MWTLLKKVKWALTLGKEVAEAVDAWQEVAAEAKTLADKYDDVPADVKAFFGKVQRAFAETKDIVE